MNDVLQVLMYFFDKIETGSPFPKEEQFLVSELKELGIPPDKIQRVLTWMTDLIQPEPEKRIEEYPLQVNPTGTRIFSPIECLHLSRKCRGFLLTLEQSGVLSATTRELVLDELLQMEPESISISRVKWVVLGILCDQPDKKAAACMERFLLTTEMNRLH